MTHLRQMLCITTFYATISNYKQFLRQGMQRVWVWSWEMLLIPPSPSVSAGAEGKPHVAALGLQSLLLFHACVTQLVTALYLQRASYEKSFYCSNMACARTQIQFLIKRNGILTGHLKNNYVCHLTDRHVTF